MSLGFYETLATINASGNAVTNTTTRTSLLTGSATHGKFTMPANRFRIGDHLHLRAVGRLSTVATTPGNLTLDIGIGSTVLFSTLAMPLNVAAKTNVGWSLDVMGRVEVVGTAGQIFWYGWFLSEGGINVAVPSTGPGPGGQNVPYNTAPVVNATTVDFTASGLWDFFSTNSVANASNSVTLHLYHLALMTSTGF